MNYVRKWHTNRYTIIFKIACMNQYLADKNAVFNIKICIGVITYFIREYFLHNICRNNSEAICSIKEK